MELWRSPLTTVAGSGLFSVISQWLLSYFSLISQLFLEYFPFLNYFSVISYLFLSYFLKIPHFLTISGLFLGHFSLLNYFSVTSRLFLIYFSTISQLLLGYFPVISRLFPGYSSSCRIMCLSWFVQQCVLNEANETIRDYFQTEVVVTSFYQLWWVYCGVFYVHASFIYNNYSMCRGGSRIHKRGGGTQIHCSEHDNCVRSTRFGGMRNLGGLGTCSPRNVWKITPSEIEFEGTFNGLLLLLLIPRQHNQFYW